MLQHFNSKKNDRTLLHFPHIFLTVQGRSISILRHSETTRGQCRIKNERGFLRSFFIRIVWVVHVKNTSSLYCFKRVLQWSHKWRMDDIYFRSILRPRDTLSILRDLLSPALLPPRWNVALQWWGWAGIEACHVPGSEWLLLAGRRSFVVRNEQWNCHVPFRGVEVDTWQPSFWCHRDCNSFCYTFFYISI